MSLTQSQYITVQENCKQLNQDMQEFSVTYKQFTAIVSAHPNAKFFFSHNCNVIGYSLAPALYSHEF